MEKKKEVSYNFDEGLEGGFTRFGFHLGDFDQDFKKFFPN